MDRVARVLARLAGVSVVYGLAIVHAVDNGYNPFTAGRLTVVMIYAGLLLLCSYAAGVPDLPENGRQATRASVTATGIAVVGVSLFQLATGTQILPRFVVLGSAASLTPIYMLAAMISMRARAERRAHERVLLVGTQHEADELIRELSGATRKPANLVSFLSPEAASAPLALLDAGALQRPTVIVLSRQAEVDSRIVSQAADLHLRGVRIRTIVDFWEEWLGKLPVSELERRSLFFDISELHSRPYRPLKRLLDVVAGGVGLVLTMAITPFVLLLNIFWNPGPLLYRQVRTGKAGVPVTILKFRTMRVMSSPESKWTIDLDERVTPFGRFLRTTHLDELPQSVNLLRGDLSVVGPRPEQPQYVAHLSDVIPFYDVRHAVRPGLTGWAQVNFAYAATTEDSLEKLQYEFYYLRHQRLLLDLQIIGRTIRSVVGGSGR